MGTYDRADGPCSPKSLHELRYALPLSPEDVTSAVALIRETEDLEAVGLAPPPRPALPSNLQKLPMRARLKTIQQYISQFEYNYTPENYFNVLKKRPLGRILDTARQIIHDSLPIKCVEAVFLALFLTAGWELDRIPLAFKTVIDGQVFRHIVLVVRHQGKYGAVGISRRAELMFKDLTYDSFSAVVTDFKEAYQKWWHKVLKIRVGLPVEHDVHSHNLVCWRYLQLKPAAKNWAQSCDALDNHAAQCKRLWERWLADGAKLASERSSQSTLSTPSTTIGTLSPRRSEDGSSRCKTSGNLSSKVLGEVAKKAVEQAKNTEGSVPVVRKVLAKKNQAEKVVKKGGKKVVKPKRRSSSVQQSLAARIDDSRAEVCQGGETKSGESPLLTTVTRKDSVLHDADGNMSTQRDVSLEARCRSESHERRNLPDKTCEGKDFFPYTIERRTSQEGSFLSKSDSSDSDVFVTSPVGRERDYRPSL